MYLPGRFIFTWRRGREKISPYVNRYTIADPARLVLWSGLLSLTIVVLCSLGELDPDTSLIKSFFKFRGATSPPEKVQLVAFTRKDFEPPLSLSSKYKISTEQFHILIARIIEMNPEKVIIDEAILPETENTKEFEEVESLLALPLVRVYSEDLIETSESYLTKILEPFQVVGLNSKKAPIFLSNKVAIQLPQITSISPVEKREALLNVYGPPRTISALTFSDILVGEGRNLSLLTDKVVFLGRQTSVFIRGQLLPKFHYTLMGDEETSHLEIQATTFANLRDGTAISVLPKKKLCLALIVVSMASIVIMFLNYSVTIAAFFLFELAIVTALYQGFAKYLWWIEGSSLLLIVPLAFFLVGSLMTLFGVSKKDEDTKESHFLK